ncbi:MAG TPA: O-antigen ligase family protein [Candidatus Acidoferrum sp.]|nr:O-antigen ligase family protein [Candidatus Acidoferrum sp.]
MPSSVALLLWFVGVVALLRFDPVRDKRTSLALWVPLAWMFIVATRLPSQWLGGGQIETVSQALEEGNAMDRTIFAGLIVLSFVILLMRSFNWGSFVARNFFLAAFLLFALTSVMWSDFPFVAFKRWFKDLGNYLVILIVVSDPFPIEAVRILFRRLCFLFIPLSILLVKYFPYIGKQYEFWSGNNMFVGAATSKNMLGVACLVSGIYFFWDTLSRWANRRERRMKPAILVNLLLFAMTLYLLRLSNSATSEVCLVLGCLVVAAANLRLIKRHPGILKVAIPIALCAYMILQFGFGINGEVAGMVGRNANLTGRTDLWVFILSMHTNPALGTGYESFWLGPRLAAVWARFVGSGINEAHNGYLEVYINLGLIGLTLLSTFLIASYRNIGKALSSGLGLASLSLALWTVLLFYNVTEAAFKGSQLMWLAFLLGAIAVSQCAKDPVRSVSTAGIAPISALPLQPTTLER